MGWELVYVLRVGGCNVWARGRAGVTRVKPIYLSKNNYVHPAVTPNQSLNSTSFVTESETTKCFWNSTKGFLQPQGHLGTGSNVRR